jgi:preprotein translocase subunit SecG
MITFLTVVYVIVCVFLILVVLLQAGRGGGMGSAFGGSSQTVFGGAGAGNFLTRLTVIMAAMFMLLSATLAYLSSSTDKDLDAAVKAKQLREEARKLSPKDKASAAGAAGAASEAAPASTPEGEPGAAPIELEAIEGEPTGTTAPEGAEQGAVVPADPAAESAPAPGDPAPPATRRVRPSAAPTAPAPAPSAAPADAPAPAPTPEPAPAPAAPTPAQ